MPAEGRIAPISRLTRWDAAAMSLVFITTFAIHAAFRLEYPGEQDAARMLIDAIVWHHEGELDSELIDYRARVIPGSLLVLKLLMDLGLTGSQLLVLMNWSAVAVASLSSVSMYVLFASLGTSWFARTSSIILLNLAPAFWLSGIYGYPHGPALLLLVIALTLYSFAAQKPSLFWAAIVAAVGATLVKADIVLCFGAFLGILIVLGRLNTLEVVKIAGLCSVSVGSVLTLHELIVDPGAAPVEFASSWNRRFPIELPALTDDRNLAALRSASGPVLVYVSIAAVVGLLLTDRWRIAVFATLWSVPPLLFWASRYGNSARHVLVAVPPMILCTAVAGQALARGRGIVSWPLIIIVAVSNYFSTKPNRTTVFPSTRLIESANLIQASLGRLADRGQELASATEQCKYIVGTSSTPYMIYFVIKDAEDLKHENRVFHYQEDGRAHTLRWDYQRDRELAFETGREERRKGCYVDSYQYREVAELRTSSPDSGTRPAPDT